MTKTYALAKVTQFHIISICLNLRLRGIYLEIQLAQMTSFPQSAEMN